MKTGVSIILSLLIICFSVMCSYGQEGDFTVKVGFFDFPGVTYVNKDGKPDGLVNDITIKTLENAGLKYTLEKYPTVRFFEYLSTGNMHVFNGLSSIPSVKASCISSTIPLFPLEMRIYYLNGHHPVAVKEDLAGHSVILIRGFTYRDWGAWIRDKKNNVVYFETDSHAAAFEMLQRGRAEYLLNYKYIDAEVLSSIKIPGLVIKPLLRVYCYFNVSKKTPNAEEILRKLEKSYSELIKEGKLKTYE